MRACEGALLLVDATQGVEAQTLANAYQAIDADLEIVPVLNKIDLPAAEPEQIKQQIEDIIGLDASDALMISAKTGLGVDEVLEAIVHRLPPPQGEAEAPLQALVVDSWYDSYLGVVTLVRVKNGALEKGQKIRFMGTGAAHPVDRVGVFTPKALLIDRLGPGEVGFITAAIKEIARRPGRRHDHRRPQARRDAAARLPAEPAGRVLRHVPDRCRRLRQSARQPRQAAPQRRQLRVRAREQLGPGPRLPLRLSRPAAPRDHPGAAGARVRPRHRHHRPLGGLPRAPDRRHGAGAAQPRRLSRPDPDRPRRGAVDQGHDPGAGRVSGRHPRSSAPRSAACSWS